MKRKHTVTLVAAALIAALLCGTALAAATGFSLRDMFSQMDADGVTRVCLTLHYSEGYAINEIARMLRVPAGTVKSRLSRARAALRAQLHDE